MSTRRLVVAITFLAVFVMAARAMDSSSPLSYISRMMSQPPMNLLSMYNCGIVGQLENCFTPSRISGSSSTSTVS